MRTPVHQRIVRQRDCSRNCARDHRFQALLVDFDGTIADTDTPDYLAWAGEFERHGLVIDREWWTAQVGAQDDGEACLAELERLLGSPVERPPVMARHEALLAKLVRATTVRPGMRELLEQASRTGMTNAVVSSASRHWVLGHLERLGLRHLFALVITRDDVAAAKPEPEPYLNAMRRLGVGADSALAIEDSYPGLQSAAAAGLACLYVPPPMADRRAGGVAEFEVTTMAGLRLRDLLVTVGGTFSCQRRPG